MSALKSKAFVKKSRLDPAWWAEKVLGVELWDGQRKMMESVRDFKKTAVKACHAPGKTYTAACLALWFLSAFKDSIVLTTAPTWNQVENLLWREIRSLHASSHADLGGSFIKKPPQLNMGQKWYAMGLSPTEPERFQGFHAPHILIIVDEASGVTPAIMGAIEGIMMSGKVHLLLLSNPTRPEGTLYEAFHRYRDHYNTISIGAYETPNLIGLKKQLSACKNVKESIAILRAAPVINKHLVTAEAVADILDQYGEDSQIYKVRVLAEFPDSSPDALIPLGHLEAAAIRWQNMAESMRWWENLPRWTHHIFGGFDPSRYGDNKTSLCAQSRHIWAPFESYQKTGTIFAAARAAEYYARHRCDEMRVDEHGIGGGPLDLLIANKRVNAIGITVASPPNDKVTFGNLRAEAYWGIKQLCESGDIWIPPNQSLIGQLSTIKYKYRPNGQIMIESKEEMTKRGVKSPDEADAMMLSMLQHGSGVVPRAVGTATDYGRMLG